MCGCRCCFARSAFRAWHLSIKSLHPSPALPPTPPTHTQAVHKIQSADGPLSLNLSKVPKMLGVLRQTWAPGAFVVSFKLETDETILVKKVKRF